MSSSSADIEARIRELELLKKQMEQQVKKTKQDNEEKFRIACYTGDKDLVEKLLPIVDFNSSRTIFYSRQDAQQQEKECEWHKDGKYCDPINNAIRGDHPDILRMLLNRALLILSKAVWRYIPHSHTPDREEYSAHESDNTDDLNEHAAKKMLLTIINTGSNTPYYWKLDQNDDSKSGFMNRHQPLLTEAILLESPKCAALLINEFDADPNSHFYEHHRGEMTGYYYTTQGNALALAIDHNLTEIALLLIKKGASLTDRYGNEEKSVDIGMWNRYSVMRWNGALNLTPLLLAAQKNNRTIVKALLDCGADTRDKYKNKTAAELTSDPDIKKMLEMPNTNKGRLSKLEKTDAIHPVFICDMTHDIMDDPVSWQGITFCREAYRKINSRYDDNHKVGPNNRMISKEEHDAILNPNKTYTLKNIKQAIDSFVNEQETKARVSKSTNRKFT